MNKINHSSIKENAPQSVNAVNSNSAAFAKAQQFIVGGVNSPVRAFKNVSGTPIFMSRGDGAYIFDIEGKKYIDYLAAFGPAIVGHAQRDVVAAVCAAVHDGFGFGTPTPIETELAMEIVDRVASAQLVRMCNSGTEATMTAIRLARAFTARDNILKFAGCYHGHSDALLVAAGSGALTLGVPDSPGVTAAAVGNTLTLPYNDSAQLTEFFKKHGKQLAAVIVEPIAGNMGCVLPQEGFLQQLRALCDQYESVLIFDEVMCGFRVASGGAQQLFDIRADLTTFGKIIGGGMPVGAIAGKSEIMQLLAPQGAVYQAGTLAGNPVAMAAGLATLKLTRQQNFYQRLENLTTRLVTGIKDSANRHALAVVINHSCAMFSIFFSTQNKITNLQEVKQSNSRIFARFFYLMCERGVYLAPSPFETWFLGAAHDEQIIDDTIAIVDEVFAILAREGGVNG